MREGHYPTDQYAKWLPSGEQRFVDVLDFLAPFVFLASASFRPKPCACSGASRRPVTAAMLDLASRAWDAMRSEDPRHFAAIARLKNAVLTDLPGAAYRHVQELPSLATRAPLHGGRIRARIRAHARATGRAWL